MKRIIAFVLVLCMTFGMIITVSAENPFAKRLGLVRLIRTMFGGNGTDYGIGEYDDGILTVYVSTKGKADADGSEKKPYATVEAARDAIREIDKTGLSGINVIVKKGFYVLDKAVAFTAEDSGTKSCPITYIGEEGAVINGGVHLTAADFTAPDKTTES